MRTSAGISQVNWLFLRDDDIRQARQVIAAAGPDSTVDSLGLGSPVERVSDLFFPGTSTLHTELRYVIFVPAILYAMQEIGGVADPYGFLKRKEAELINCLLKGGAKQGVIGRTRGEALKYWPSMTYWTAFQAYGALGEGGYERVQVLERLTKANPTNLVSDDGDDTDEEIPAFKGEPEFKPMGLSLFKDYEKATWPDRLTFDLTKREANFLFEQLHKLHPDSLYTELFRLRVSKFASVGSIFKLKPKRPELRDLLHQAHLYSCFAMGATLAYRWALCDFLAKESKASDVKSAWRYHKSHNQRLFSQWLEIAGVLKGWEAKNLSIAAHTAYPGLVGLDGLLEPGLAKLCNELNQLFQDTHSIEAKLSAASPLVKNREQVLKGNRSRFFDPSIAIPENVRATQDSELAQDLYSYRWAWGRGNAQSIKKGLGES